MKNINKIADYGIKIVKNIAIAGIIYTGILLVAQGISQETSQRINNQSQLEQILNIERKRAGIKNEMIINISMSNNKEDISEAEKIGEKYYQITLSPRSSNLSTLRHELYHITDGHCDETYNDFKYFFWNEPQATIYQITGLKP